MTEDDEREDERERDRRLMPPPLPLSTSARARLAAQTQAQTQVPSNQRTFTQTPAISRIDQPQQQGSRGVHARLSQSQSQPVSHQHSLSQSSRSIRGGAPSLPGYGPPRTASDAVRRGSRSGSETETDEERSEYDRRRMQADSRNSSMTANDDYANTSGSMISNREQQQFLQRQSQQPSPYQIQQMQIQHQLQQQQQREREREREMYGREGQRSYNSSVPPSRILSPTFQPQQPPRQSISASISSANLPRIPPSTTSLNLNSDSIARIATPIARPTSAQPIDAALDRLQISLAALHERLSTLENKDKGVATGVNDTRIGGEGALVQLMRYSFTSLLQLFHLSSAASTSSSAVSIKVILQRLLVSSLKGIKRLVNDLAIIILLVGIVGKIGGGSGLLNGLASGDIIQRVLRKVIGDRSGQVGN
jgi:hypothetical protein